MRIDRLYNALVLGGAALGMACGSDGASDDSLAERSDVEDGLDAGRGGSGGESSSGEGGEGGASPAAARGGSEAGGATSAAGADSGGSAGAGVDETDAGGAESLTCNPSMLPTDPCGCPCCWLTDCANDEPCCASFCASGDDGRGCCGT